MVETFGYTLEEIALAFDSTTSLPTAHLVEQAKAGQLSARGEMASQSGSVKGREGEESK